MSDIVIDAKGNTEDIELNAVEEIEDTTETIKDKNRSVVSNIKNKSQTTVSNLVDFGKDQPDDVKTWGVAAAAGLAGALSIVAVAKGILAVVSTVANPVVAIPIGAIGGGALGWSYMRANAKSDVAEGIEA